MEININLIPPYRKEELERARHLKLIIKSEIGITLLLAVLFLFVLGLNKSLDLGLAAITSSQNIENNQDQYKAIDSYNSNFSNINKNVTLVTKIKKDQLYWDILFSKLSADINPGITITNLANKDYDVYMAGNADTRDNLIAWRDKLTSEDCFQNVDLPLSNLVSDNNISFQMDFTVKSDCLKPHTN